MPQDLSEYAERTIRLEERMNTMQADLSATLERFEKGAARREIGMLIAVIVIFGIGLTAHGFFTSQLQQPTIIQMPVPIVGGEPVQTVAQPAQTPARTVIQQPQPQEIPSPTITGSGQVQQTTPEPQE